MALDTIHINVLVPDTVKVKSYFKDTFIRFGSEPVLKLLFYYDYYKYRLDENFFIYRIQITLALPKLWILFLLFSGLFFLINGKQDMENQQL
jgi:hypothetical protein